MDNNYLIKKLINLGVVTLEINGTKTIPDSFQYDGSGVKIDNKSYNNSDNIVIKSINLKKLKTILKIFDSIISLSGSDEIDEIEFKQIRAIDVLRNLDKAKNDFERLDHISSIMSEKKLFDDNNSSFLNPNNQENEYDFGFEYDENIPFE